MVALYYPVVDIFLYALLTLIPQVGRLERVNGTGASNDDPVLGTLKVSPIETLE